MALIPPREQDVQTPQSRALQARHVHLGDLHFRQGVGCGWGVGVVVVSTPEHLRSAGARPEGGSLRNLYLTPKPFALNAATRLPACRGNYRAMLARFAECRNQGSRA